VRRGTARGQKRGAARGGGEGIVSKGRGGRRRGTELALVPAMMGYRGGPAITVVSLKSGALDALESAPMSSCASMEIARMTGQLAPNYRNHREMTELNDLERNDRHWSESTMSFAELMVVFSSLSQSDVKH
jgi:hypothetical protein